MAIQFPSSATPSTLRFFPANVVNPSTISTAGLSDSTYPYMVKEGFHAGTIDFNKWGYTLDAYDGCGFNKYGFYGVRADPLGAIPTILISSRNFVSPDWGNVYGGDFRVGDNVKEDGDTLVGSNWLWYTPRHGLNIAGPLLRTTSSDVNIIQSPGFDSLTEFTLVNFVANTTEGFATSQCIEYSDVRGSILYKASADFSGECTLKLVLSDSTEDSSIITLQKDGAWHRFDYALRLANEDLLTFTVAISVTGAGTGTLLLDNWNAYRVFEYPILTSNIPDELPDRSFIIEDLEHPEVLTKTFQLNANSGSAYFRGNILVKGYVHTGTLYDSSGNETLEDTAEGWDGCGINRYGVYGTSYNTTSGEKTSYFLLAAKTIPFVADPYWGSGFSKGELRVGNNVALNSEGDELLGSGNYLWFHPDNGLVLSGKLYAGNFLFGEGIADLSGVSQSGLYLDSDNYWLDSESTGTSGVLKAGGIYVTEDQVEIGVVDTHTVVIGNEGDSSKVSLTNLTLTGNLVLSDNAEDDLPSSYIGIIEDTASSFFSKDGIAFGSKIASATEFTWDSFILAPSHTWTTDSSWFYTGTGFTYDSGGAHTLGDNYLFFNGTQVQLSGVLNLQGDNDFVHIGSAGVENCGYISKNAIAFFGDKVGVDSKVKVLIGASGHPWLGTEYGSSIIIGDDVENHEDPNVCENLFRYTSGDTNGLLIRSEGVDIVDLVKSKPSTYVQNDEPGTEDSKLPKKGDKWIDTDDENKVYDLIAVTESSGTFTYDWQLSSGVVGRSLYVVYNDDTSSPTTPSSVSYSSTAGADGWHTVLTSSSKWMSQKLDEEVQESSDWGEPIKINAEDGQSVAEVFCYYLGLTLSTPTKPAEGAVSYSFSTNTLTGLPSGWTAYIPVVSSTDECVYVCKATAVSDTINGTDNTLSWSSPINYLQHGIDSSYVIVTGEQVFKETEGIIAPTSIDLSVNKFNCIGGEWEYKNASSTWTAFTPIENNSTLTVTTTNLIDNIGHFRFKVSDGITDEITVVKLVDGVAGTDSITVTLSNETHTFPADSNGVVAPGDYGNSGTEIRVYKGTSVVTYDGGASPANDTWKVGTSATNITVSGFSVASNVVTYADTSGMTANTAEIVFNIIFKDSNGDTSTFNKTQTFSISKTGATGATGDPGDPTPPIASIGGNFLIDGDFALTSSSTSSDYWDLSTNVTLPFGGINGSRCASFGTHIEEDWPDYIITSKNYIPVAPISDSASDGLWYKFYFQFFWYQGNTSATSKVYVGLNYYDANKVLVGTTADTDFTVVPLTNPNGWKVQNGEVSIDVADTTKNKAAFITIFFAVGETTVETLLLDHLYLGEHARSATQGATWGIDGVGIDGLPGFLKGSVPGESLVTGLNMTSNYFGYYNGYAWRVKIGNTGELYAGDGTTSASSNNHFIYWNPNVSNPALVVAGNIHMYDGYVRNKLVIGSESDSNYIELNRNSTYPYIRSMSFNTTITTPSGSGSGYHGWKLDYNGNFYCTRIIGKRFMSSGSMTNGYLQLLGTEVGVATSLTNFAGGLLYVNSDYAGVFCRANNGDSFMGIAVSLGTDSDENTGQLGFFNSWGTQKQTATGDLANLITILRNYGLVG